MDTYTNTVLVVKPAPQLIHFYDQRSANQFISIRRKKGEECKLYKYDPARTFVQALIEMRKQEVGA